MSNESDKIGDRATDLMMNLSIEPDINMAVTKLCIRYAKLEKQLEEATQAYKRLRDDKFKK